MKDVQLGIIETGYNVATCDPDNILVLVLPAIIQQNSIIVNEQMSMNRKYHNYRLQTNPRQHEEEKTYLSNAKQCGILTSVDSNEPVQPPFKLQMIFSQ